MYMCYRARISRQNALQSANDSTLGCNDALCTQSRDKVLSPLFRSSRGDRSGGCEANVVVNRAELANNHSI